jgi:lysine-N-methylase
VVVDKDHYEKLKRAMSQTRALREEFAAKHERADAATRTSQGFATMKMQENGNCCMLDADGLCASQRRFGASVLSNTCALYPRLFSEHANRIEMAGTLSCPEIARRALLHDDALDLVDFDPAIITSGHTPNLQWIDPKNAYAGYLDDIRSTVYELLSLPDYSVSVRLFFVSYFAAGTAEFFHRDVSTVDERRLGEAIRSLQSPALRAELSQWYRERAVPDQFVAKFIVELLKIRASHNCLPALHALVNRALATYEGSASDPGKPLAPAVVERLTTDYNQRKAALVARFGGRIDRYFENFAKNYWMKEWYARSRNLLVHEQDLLFRIAVQRFLLISLANIPPEADEPEAIRLLDQEMVRVAYTISRGVEHSPAFLQKLTQALEAPEMEMLAHTVCLIKF